MRASLEKLAISGFTIGEILITNVLDLKPMRSKTWEAKFSALGEYNLARSRRNCFVRMSFKAGAFVILNTRDVNVWFDVTTAHCVIV
ncbi:hypothetical protein TNCV_2768611 [Trichonephila clavipes]|nr:hypothetical protein TNCV_2768611 [Trichonephila clavipes]